MFIWKGARSSCRPPAYFTVALRNAPQLSEANAVPCHTTPMSSLHSHRRTRFYRLPIYILPRDSVLHALFPDTNFSMGSS